MRTIIIYRDSDDTYPEVRSWLADFHRQYPDKGIEEFSPDDSKVDDLIRLHGLNKFPVIVAIDDQDKIIAQWMDEMLPKLSDVAYYSEEKADRPDTDGFSSRNDHKIIEAPVSTESDDN